MLYTIDASLHDLLTIPFEHHASKYESCYSYKPLMKDKMIYSLLHLNIYISKLFYTVKISNLTN